MTERRFRGKLGWAVSTAYIAIRGGIGYVVKTNGTEYKIVVYTLEYCLAQVELGNWMEIHGHHEWEAIYRCDYEEVFCTDAQIYKLHTTILSDAAGQIEAELDGKGTLITLRRIM